MEIGHEVDVNAATLARLDLDAWNLLSGVERSDLAALLIDALNAAGHAFHSPRVQDHGPNGDQPVLELQDGRTGLTFALVPGGRFAPGYDEDELAAYRRAHQRLLGWPDNKPWTDLDCDEGPASEHEYYDPPRRTIVMARSPRCDLRLKPEGRVGPFLMATLPVPVPSLRKAASLPLPAWFAASNEREAAMLDWQHVQPVLAPFGWALPTSSEYEWALRGGKRGVFYWGDELPAFVLEHGAVPGPELEPTEDEIRQASKKPGVRFEDVMLEELDPERPRVWPYANRFGLAAMLPWLTWCARIPRKGTRYPLVVRGGAMHWWGWQGCGEWKLLCNAVEGRLSPAEALRETHALRPVIRLLPAA